MRGNFFLMVTTGFSWAVCSFLCSSLLRCGLTPAGAWGKRGLILLWGCDLLLGGMKGGSLRIS